MTILLLLLAAVLPAVLLVWFFHARDTFPEPPRVLWTTFALGCASVVPAVIVGMIVEPVLTSTDAVVIAAAQAFVIAALCEESSKLAVLLGYSFRRSEFDEPMDGIVYGATVSLGFAALENVFYVLDGGFAIALMRGVLSVPGHATYGAVMGYYVGRARFDRENRKRLIGLGLLAAVMLHGFYNFPLMLMDPGDGPAREVAVPSAAPGQAGEVSGHFLAAVFALGLAAVVIGWTWALRLVRRVRLEQAPHGTARPAAEGEAAPPGAPGAAWAKRVPAAPVANAEARATTAAQRRWRLAAGWLAVFTGAAAALGGGLLTVAAVAFGATGHVPEGDLLSLAVGTLLIGVLPAAGGAALLALGVRALNRGA